MSKEKKIIIVGGGIIGLSAALNIKHKSPNTQLILIEKEISLASHQTSHNSGVIHSGLYYKPGSLKAINCQIGYKLMLDFCNKYSIPHEICGKIVVARSSSEIPILRNLHLRGLANGLKDLKFLNLNEIQEIEPHCIGIQGLLVPQTGIVDYASVARKMQELLENMGVEILLGEAVLDLKSYENKVEISSKLKTWIGDAAVICAGLQSDRLALKSDPNLPLRILPFRGEYYQFKLNAPKLVNNLIYPVPDPAFPFLGVHFTRMINGNIECGPNAIFSLGRETYKKTEFNLRDLADSLAWSGFRAIIKKHWRKGLDEYYRSFSKTAFVKELQKYIPDIKSDYLEPGEAGIRAQACDQKGNLLDDFEIFKHNNIIHVCNAPSPAATASLAIGKRIADSIMEIDF